MKKSLTIVLAALFMCVSCGGGKTTVPSTKGVVPTAQVEKPTFNADSAYSYVKAQTDFGPRVPNSTAHKKCAEWLEQKLKSFGAETVVQNIQVTTFDGTLINGYNIIGQINPESNKRIILCAHWDSRPWADNDPDPANHKKPVDGANDGASGVGVILEIARQLQIKAPAIGIDCIFFDAEDWGPGDSYTGRSLPEHWGLGSQYWSRRQHKDGYMARYAVLLDMVGGKGARFYKEGISNHYAKGIVDKYWEAAGITGHRAMFPIEDGGFVTDDHYFINSIAHIPAIDIVPYLPECKESNFGPTWHTINDNIDNIDKATLQAVGETVLYVIYNEK